MKVINLFGAPGAGKSTTMLGLTYKMKMMGLSAENTPEFFKELIFEESSTAKFGGQLHILDNQNIRLARLEGKNDFTISDCPLPLIGFYTKNDYIKGFHEVVTNLFHQYDNINYFILRKHEYEHEKRIHNEDESDNIAIELPLYLKKHGVDVIYIDSSEDLVEKIIEDLINKSIISKEKLKNSRNKNVRNLHTEE